jgi:hypothetical protein
LAAVDEIARRIVAFAGTHRFVLRALRRRTARPAWAGPHCSSRLKAAAGGSLLPLDRRSHPASYIGGYGSADGHRRAIMPLAKLGSLASRAGWLAFIFRRAVRCCGGASLPVSQAVVGRKASLVAALVAERAGGGRP